jgi:hypothetical protein
MDAVLSAALNGFVVSIPLACAVWVVLRVSRWWLNAATRYGIWWIVLGAVAALPVLYLPVRPASHAEMAPANRSSTVISPVAAPAPLPVAQEQPAGRALRHESASTGRLWPVRLRPGIWSARFVQLWVLAAMLMGLRLVVSYFMLHRRKTRATDTGGGLNGVCGSIAGAARNSAAGSCRGRG